jgi:nucleoside-diphosphate-sugar epimerase
MHILLTGAHGFLGRPCARRLRECGHTVTTTDLVGEVDLRGDLADADFTRQLPDVEAVVHAAAVQYVTPTLPLLNRGTWFRRNNIEATRLLVQRYGGSDIHFVNIGTSMMYAQNGAPQYGTGSPMMGQGVYSRSKLTAQQLVEQGMPRWATVIPCIIGGPGREGLFRNFVRAIARGRAVTIPGRGAHPVAMVHVDDVARLVELIIRCGAAGAHRAPAPEAAAVAGGAERLAPAGARAGADADLAACAGHRALAGAGLAAAPRQRPDCPPHRAPPPRRRSPARHGRGSGPLSPP